MDEYKHCILVALDGEVVHMCLYEKKPSPGDVDSLIEELATDPEFGLTHVPSDQLRFKVISK